MDRSINKNDRFFLFLLICIACTATLPFLNHAFYIDEPLFLKIADQIRKDFFHPYHFEYIWGNTYKPVDQIAAFPPLFSYYLALSGLLLKSSSETLIHSSLLLFVFLSLFSFYGICRKFKFSSRESFFGTAFLLISPSFVLSANLAIPDLAALSFLLASIYLLIRSSSIFSLLSSGVFLGIASLLRYNVLPFIPVLFFWGVTFFPFRLRKEILPSLIGALFFLGWIIFSSKSNEDSHVATVLSTFLRLDGGAFFTRVVAVQTHLTFSTFLPFLFFIFFKIEKRIQTFLFLFSVGIGFTLFLLKMVSFAGLAFAVFSIFLSLFTFYFACQFCGSVFKKNSLKESSENINFKIALLFLGAIFSLSIPLLYIHFASKYLLLLQPFLILIFLLKTKPYFEKSKIGFYFIPFLLLFSCLLAKVDFFHADLYRKKAQEQFFAIKKSYPLAKIWFIGHFGWQYYLEQLGAAPLPSENFKLGFPESGDIILAIEKLACPQPVSPLLENRLKLFSQENYFPPFHAKTMNAQANAGFYSNAWGIFPYGISESSLETFKVFQVLPN